MTKSHRDRGLKTHRNPAEALTSCPRLPGEYPWLVSDRLVTDLAEYMPEQDVIRYRDVIRRRNILDYLALAKEWGLQSIPTLTPGSDLTQCKIRLLLGSTLKKYPFPGDTEARSQAAMTKVLEAEDACKVFNRKSYKHLNDPDGKPSKLLCDMQEFALAVLGPQPEASVTTWCRHGPGASTGTSKGYNCSYHKYSLWPYHVTAVALADAKRLILSDERWLGALEDSYRTKYHIEMWCILDWSEFWKRVFHIVPGNRITTVPKDCLSDRPIAIEPTLNMMLQLGVDGFIRRRLRRWGIDLDDQTRNQRLARDGTIGSHADKPATLDLSNASDMVSLRLIKLVLPPAWSEYVLRIRSPKGTFPNGVVKRYHRFASMGNGSTFAMESLLFAAVAYAAGKEVFGHYRRDLICVYGDDIIVPESMALITSHYLGVCGFILNKQKSFLTGPIKESCGTDWIHGSNVRPVFLKELPEDIGTLFSHRNLLVRWASQHLCCDLSCTCALYDKWLTPEQRLLVGPLSDTEFSGFLHQYEPGRFDRCSYWFRSIVQIPRSLPGVSFLFRKLMHPLRQGSVQEPVSNFERRRKLAKSGNAFTVTARGRLRTRIVARCCLEWQQQYSSPDTIRRGESPCGSHQTS